MSKATERILWTPNAVHTFSFGNEYGQLGYVVGGSWEDAYEEVLDHLANLSTGSYVCDHGGEITDEQREAAFDGSAPTGSWWNCDCTLSDSGVWVDDQHLWLRPLHQVPVEFAFEMEDLAELFEPDAVQRF